ncbi:MAG: NAD-dependent DNA ligase LigA [Bacteroidales bacterium]|nr:NAD-dependent DNA ligase LigA [Bacteroidales bacterium]
MDKPTARKKIAELTNQLHRHNYRYYVLNSPEISDYEYDMMMKELQELEKQFPDLALPDSPTQRVGSDIDQKFEQVPHRVPMLSLDNTYNEQELTDFLKRINRNVTEQVEYICELKYDGVAISLRYENGYLQQAITRGDGYQGDDVTENIKTIRSIPLRLLGKDYPASFEIRGEIYMSHQSFEELNKERRKNNKPPFANPRNSAAGTLKMQKSSQVARRSLDCFLYQLVGEALPYNTDYDNLQKAKEWGLKIPEHISRCATIKEIFDFINYWDRERKNLSYDTDGVVVKVNQYHLREQLGYTAKSPRWAIAYKFQAEQVATQLQSVSFQVGRTGRVTPVANLKPVSLAGTTVKRASLHNEDIIRNLDLRHGDTVWVEKGGEIIPKIIDVDKSRRFPDSRPVTFIEKCPQCETPLIRNEDEAAHYCPNEKGCPPQIKGRIIHFCSRDAMDIEGLGKDIINRFVNKGFLHEIVDIYKLKNKRRQLEGLEVLSKEQEGLDRGVVPLSRVLYAFRLGVNSVKEAELLEQAYGSVSGILSANREDESGGDQKTEAFKASAQQELQSSKNQYLRQTLQNGETGTGNIRNEYVLYALNIPGLSFDDCRKLAEDFDFVYEVFLASDEELSKFLGRDKMDAIRNVFSVKKTYNLINNLNHVKKIALQKKSVDNILNGIEQSKQQPFEKVLYGLGIRFIGLATAKLLVAHFSSIDKMMEASHEDFNQIEGIGPRIAGSLTEYFSDSYYRGLIDRMRHEGLNFEKEQNRETSESAPLEGATFVITGTLPTYSRKEAQNIIEENGGKVTSSVSSNTTYLLSGENPGSKLTKAKQLGVNILEEDEFKKLLQGIE